MLSVAQVAVCSQIITKHTNKCGQDVKFLEVKLLVHHVTSRQINYFVTFLAC